jgi:hypothetical protein
VRFWNLAFVLFLWVSSAAAADIGPAAVRRAVEKALPLMQGSSQQFFDKSGCISCHNQSLPAMAVGLARQKGFAVDERLAQVTVNITAAVFSPHRQNLLLAINTIPAAPEVSSYALLGLAAENYPADEMTDAMVHDLAQKQRADGRWHNADSRPPLGHGSISVTALTLRALQLYPLEGRKEEFRKRIEQARDWLLTAAPGSNEETSYRLQGLGWAKAKLADIQKAAKELLAEQRQDGGWAWLPTLDSEAYSTGQALVALHQAAGLSTTDPACQRGAKYLLKTQLPDGSWHVKTPAMGFQPYFEDGFPHGEDQWLSIAGTSWATMGLALTVEPKNMASRR